MTPEPILVRKLNLQGEETWQYHGTILQRSSNRVLLEAQFNRDDIPFYDIVLRRGDRFVEEFFTDRWYNIFEIHDWQDNQIKGWYCNIAYPAILEDESIAYIDLALDLLVYPSGKQVVLDMDEFEALSLSVTDRAKALEALAELQALFRERNRKN